MRGKFISLEGIDGAGKSTHIPFIRGLLEQNGITVVSSREPGGTNVGELIRELVLREKMHLETEALLMFASRREHIDKVIMPSLERGDWVLCDRFTDSSFAYQVGGRGLQRSKLDMLERWACGPLYPDLTFLFDVPTHVARKRLDDNTVDQDKFEQEQAQFFIDTRNEYLRRADQFPARFRILDATQSIAELQVRIKSTLEQLISDT